MCLLCECIRALCSSFNTCSNLNRYSKMQLEMVIETSGKDWQLRIGGLSVKLYSWHDQNSAERIQWYWQWVTPNNRLLLAQMFEVNFHMFLIPFIPFYVWLIRIISFLLKLSKKAFYTFKNNSIIRMFYGGAVKNWGVRRGYCV